MARAGKAPAAHVVVDASHAAVANACNRGYFAHHALGSGVRAGEYGAGGGGSCGGHLGLVAPLAAAKRAAVVLARAPFVLRPYPQALFVKGVAAACTAPIERLPAVEQALHADGAGVVLGDLFLRHFQGRIACNRITRFLATVHVDVGVEAAPDELFDFGVYESMLPAQRVVCWNAEHLVHDEKRVKARLAAGLQARVKQAQHTQRQS